MELGVVGGTGGVVIPDVDPVGCVAIVVVPVSV